MKRLMVTALVLSSLVGWASAGTRVEIRIDVPKGAEAYTGPQPLTFGVPFARGALRKSDGVRVVDERGRAVPAQFDVTATWSPKGDEVRWLLVDTVVPIRNGKPPRRFLEFGPDAPAPPKDASVPAPTGTAEYCRYVIRDGKGKRYVARIEKLTVERSGPVRIVVKATGAYVAADGDRIAGFVTRVRYYAKCPFLRLYHTMVWLKDQRTRLGSLVFTPPGPLGPGKASAGVDGRRAGPAASIELAQTNWNTVIGTAKGEHWDGWAQVADERASLFLALRWPWQQFPVSVAAGGGRIGMGLLGPKRPMSFDPMDVAVDYVKTTPRVIKSWNLRIFQKDPVKPWSVRYNGVAARPHVSPRGIAKTWEMLLWRDAAHPKTPPEVKNVFAQHPVLAYADPAFACRASIPSPMSPRDAKRFPVIENALERAFGWITRENPFDGDYGVWNFGDIQWCWVGRAGYTCYRYWMNHGKGWSIAPWALWLRSGDRRYLENAEVNSRHCMDVDMCHVPEWERAPDGKVRGGQNHYSALHWGYGPGIATFFVDSEYLPYPYYVTGYERAWDVTLERAELLARDDWRRRVDYFEVNGTTRSRHLYAVVKDLAALYEATWDRRLLPYLRAYLDLTLGAQLPNGQFLNITSNHYLDQPLLLAARALPDRREQIVQALKKWYAFRGDWIAPRPGSAATGPHSLWTAYALYRSTKDARYRKAAVLTARAQALCVADNGTIWNGMTAFPAHLAGPILRDWPAAMKSAESDPTATPGFAPLTHLNGQLPLTKEQKAQWPKSRGRHVMLTLNETGKPCQVNLHFTMHNQGGRQTSRVRVHAPDGKIVVDRTLHVEASRTDPKAVQGVTVDLPAAGRGVYAVEFWRKIRALPVYALSSTGKLVHYMPEGQRAFCSPTFGGRVWFPTEAGKEVSIGFPHRFPLGRLVALDPDDRVVATSRITGTAERKSWVGMRQLPVGVGLRFKPKRAGLYSFSAGNWNWHGVQAIRGMKPWFATSREAWFDPEKHSCPDLKALASGRN